ncbi:exopolysaccharide biosynthesis polyprenyl glycosylphosphotransferase [Candidatus Margulisiibacteriota bacterium]
MGNTARNLDVIHVPRVHIHNKSIGLNCTLIEGLFKYEYHQKVGISEHQELIKAVFDKVATTFLLAALAPLMLTIGLAIKLTSSGPAVFVQKRVGKNGKIFDFYKFRSMNADAEDHKKELMKFNEMDGPAFKILNDPRLTSLGKLLRKTSLDELPQLFNVLKGDMSLVGPRPPLPEEVAQYKNWHFKRLSVRPGITCIWQVSGRNNIKSFTDWIRSDLFYIDNYSFLNDIKLLLKTVKVVLMRTGAH